MPAFGKQSRTNLHSCDPRLIAIMYAVVAQTDCTILEGHRDRRRQDRLLEMGKTKVAWPTSKHNNIPSLAVDVAPWPIPTAWGAEWKERVKFYELGAVVRHEAAKLGLSVRWGGDWDGDRDYTDQTFDDLVHFELE